MDQDKPNIDEHLLRLHDGASQYAVAVNAAVAEKFGGRHPFPLAGGALYRIGADAVAFHEAVLALCATGWVSCTAPLLRSLMDLLLSTSIIAEIPDEAELRGFRYSHFFLKSMLLQDDGDQRMHKYLRSQIEFGIKQLNRADQLRARRFIFNDRPPAYWYAPDYYGRPQEAADKLLNPEIARYYSTLSSAAHGGFFGLGLFRDQPDVINPNRRDDPRSNALALCISIRITIEHAYARDKFELGGQLSQIYRSLLEELSRYRGADADAGPAAV